MPYYDYSRGIGKGLEAIGQAIAAIQGMKVQLAAQKAKMEYDEQQQRNEYNQRLEIIDYEHKRNLESIAKQYEYNLQLNKLREISDMNQKIITSNYDKGYILKSGIAPDNERILSSDDFVMDTSNPENRVIDDAFLSSSGLSPQQQKLLSPYKGFPLRNAKEALQQAYYMQQQESLLSRQKSYADYTTKKEKELALYKQNLENQDAIRDFILKNGGGGNKQNEAALKQLAWLQSQEKQMIYQKSNVKEGDKDYSKKREFFDVEANRYKTSADSLAKIIFQPGGVSQNIDPNLLRYIQQLGGGTSNSGGKTGDDQEFFGSKDFTLPPVTNDGFIGPMPLSDNVAGTAVNDFTLPPVNNDGFIGPTETPVEYTQANDPFGYYALNHLRPPKQEEGLAEAPWYLDPIDIGAAKVSGALKLMGGLIPKTAETMGTMFPAIEETATGVSSGIRSAVRSMLPKPKPSMSEDSITALRELGQEIKAEFDNRQALIDALKKMATKKQAARAARQSDLESAFTNYDSYIRAVNQKLYNNPLTAQGADVPLNRLLPPRILVTPPPKGPVIQELANRGMTSNQQLLSSLLDPNKRVGLFARTKQSVQATADDVEWQALLHQLREKNLEAAFTNYDDYAKAIINKQYFLEQMLSTPKMLPPRTLITPSPGFPAMGKISVSNPGVGINNSQLIDYLNQMKQYSTSLPVELL